MACFRLTMLILMASMPLGCGLFDTLDAPPGSDGGTPDAPDVDVSVDASIDASVDAGASDADADICVVRETECADDPTAGDGRDNDCDGIVDEGCHCDFQDLAEGICARGIKDGDDGTCSAPAFFVPDEDDLCDGEDNDCDGVIDEGCTCDFMGAAEGVCQGIPLTQQGACQAPDTYVADEGIGQCDGEDNDCDGETDEGCTCVFMGLTEGICEGLTRSGDGTCAEPDGFVNQETNCDERDDDCDGEVDEECFINTDPGAPLSTTASIQIDFGEVDSPAQEWTNITNCDSSSVDDLIDSKGQATRIDLTVFGFERNADGPVSNSVGVPSTASNDSCYAGDFSGRPAATAASGLVTLTSLDPRASYDLVLYGARLGADRFMSQTVDRLGRYSIEGATTVFKEMEATDNNDTSITFTSVRPGPGGGLRLLVEVSPNGTGRFAYINSLVLTRNP